MRVSECNVLKETLATPALHAGEEADCSTGFGYRTVNDMHRDIGTFQKLPTCGFLSAWDRTTDADVDTCDSNGNQNFTLRRSCVSDYLSMVCASLPDDVEMEEVANRIVEDEDGAMYLAFCCIADGPECNSMELLWEVQQKVDVRLPTYKDDLGTPELAEYKCWYDEYKVLVGEAVCTNGVAKGDTVSHAFKCLVNAAMENDELTYDAIVDWLEIYQEDENDVSPLEDKHMLDGWQLVKDLGERRKYIHFNWVSILGKTINERSFYGHSYDVAKCLLRQLRDSYIIGPHVMAAVIRNTPTHAASLMCGLWKEGMGDGDTMGTPMFHVDVSRKVFYHENPPFEDWRVSAEVINAVCRTVGASRSSFLRELCASCAPVPPSEQKRGSVLHVAGVIHEAKQKRQLSRAFDAWLEGSNIYSPTKFLGRRGRDEFENDMSTPASEIRLPNPAGMPARS